MFDRNRNRASQFSQTITRGTRAETRRCALRALTVACDGPPEHHRGSPRRSRSTNSRARARHSSGRHAMSPWLPSAASAPAAAIGAKCAVPSLPPFGDGAPGSSLPHTVRGDGESVGAVIAEVASACAVAGADSSGGSAAAALHGRSSPSARSVVGRRQAYARAHRERRAGPFPR